MRPPARRAPALFSLIFTGALGVPLLVLLTMLGKIGVSFGLPSFTGAMTGLVFHAALYAMLAVIVGYWLFLTIFPTLGMLTVLGLVAYFFRPQASTKEHED